MRWIKNYTEFNFRSLGSYTDADFEEIAVALLRVFGYRPVYDYAGRHAPQRPNAYRVR